MPDMDQSTEIDVLRDPAGLARQRGKTGVKSDAGQPTNGGIDTARPERTGIANVSPTPVPQAKHTDRPACADKISDQQWLFVQEWFVDYNAKQAAIRAGYSARSARVIGPRMLSNSRVATVVRELLPLQAGMSAGMILSMFAKIAGSKNATNADAIAALDKLAKVAGLYRERPDAATQINVVIHPAEADL